MNDSLSFKVNSCLTIQFLLPAHPKKISLCDDIEIVLHFKGDQYLVYTNDCISWGLGNFNEYLELAINDQLELDHSISKDLGYLWNEKLYLSTRKKIINKDQIFENYLLWSYNKNMVWLYNQKEKIILQVTPSYPWHYSSPKKDEKYISYKKFMQSYQSCFTVEINKVDAIKLLEQTSFFYKSIEEKETNECH